MRQHFVAAAAASLLCTPAFSGEQLTIANAAELRTTLDALQGRVVLVNFWATWCSPCLKEIPMLLQLQAELADRDFSLIAVSLDEVESSETLVRPFMSKWFPGFSSYQSGERDMDDMVSVVDPAWNEVLPTTYLLTRDGNVAEIIQGANTAEEFTAKILPLLE